MSAFGTSATPRAVWQVSAGPASRSYADVLLKHSIVLIDLGFESMAYANLARLKKRAADLFARLKRP